MGARTAIILLALGLAGLGRPPEGEAGRAGRTCAHACARTAKACVAAAREERRTRLAACATQRGAQRPCQATARAAAKATGRACATLKRACRTCCAAGQTTCETPRVTQDASRTASAVLTPDGGTLTATAADGTIYTLDVPPRALLDDTTISLTPVTAIGGFAVGGTGLRAAVQAEPSGLQFLTPATLTITSSAEPAEPPVAFGWDGIGTDFHRELATVAGGSLRVPVTHFSGFGMGGESAPELRAITAMTPTGGDSLGTVFMALGGADREQYVALMRARYRNVVRPGLQAGVGSDPALRQALRDYDYWLFILEGGPLALGLPFELASAFTAERAEAKTLIAAALRDAIARADARCLARHSLAEAETALGWQVIADMADVDTIANALDLDTVLDGLCVEAHYDDVTFPTVPPLAIPSVLRVRVGLTFLDGTPATGDRMEVQVIPRGTEEGSPIGATDASGTIEFTFTPLGDRELRLDVHACADVAGRRRLRQVCQDAFVIRGLALAPGSATVAPGGTQQFTATLFGQPATVTWSTTAGSIDAHGLLTAGTTSGTFEVRATNPVDGRSTAATVVVGNATTTTTTTLPGSSIAIVSRDSSVFARVSVASACQPNTAGDQVRSTSLDPFAPPAVGRSLTCTSPNGLGGTFTETESAAASQSTSVTLNSAASLLVVTGTLSASASADIACNPPHPSCPNHGSQGTGSGSGIGVEFDVLGASQPYRLDESGGPTTNCGFQLRNRVTFATTFLSDGQLGTLQPGQYLFVASCGAGAPVSGSPESNSSTFTFAVGS